MNLKPAYIAVSAIALMGYAGASQAQTVVEKTRIEVEKSPITSAQPGEIITTKTKQTMVNQIPVAGESMRINFDDFDRDGNGILSMSEVGEHLFYIFDTDGNQVIDNIEFNNKRIITVAPMEKRTLTMVDVESATGSVVTKTYDYEKFYSESGLSRFDKEGDGLSPAKFIGTSFLKLDKDGSKAIELDEWKAGYEISRAPKAADQDNYNN